ncbi:MAG: CDP-glycerol glycerophosphotransferase family protein [Pseudomonadota bacterium]
MNLTGLRRAVSEFVFALLSRLLAQPVGWLLPRDPRLWLVLGREHGRYLDNAKYFHAWLHANLPAGHRVVFVGERRGDLARVAAAGGTVAHYPDWRACGLLLRAGNVVFDSADAIDHGRIGLMAGARRVQLWHGAPLKEIELPLHQRRLATLPALLQPALRFQKFVLGRYAAWDVLVSTSRHFTEYAFRTCLPARQIVETGYPRNDVLAGADGYPAALLRVNVDENAEARLSAHRARGGRVVLYAPTFRADHGSPFADGHLDLAELSRFASAHDVLFAMKLHPVMSGRCVVDTWPGVVEIDAASDVYPLLSEVDVLVTDYSSIFFDFLLLDRPIVFYPYDLDRYTTDERRLLFPYEAMTPGPKARDFPGLLAALAAVLSGDGEWPAQRARVRALAFEHHDGQASRRLAQALLAGAAS